MKNIKSLQNDELENVREVFGFWSSSIDPKYRLEMLNNFEQVILASVKSAASFIIEDANSLLRSALSIAERKGQNTNWEAFAERLKIELADQHSLMYIAEEKYETKK